MKAYFTLSEAFAERVPDWEDRALEVELGELGAQLTYNDLRDCETGDTIATSDAEGLWVAEADGRAYSDVVIA